MLSCGESTWFHPLAKPPCMELEGEPECGSRWTEIFMTELKVCSNQKNRTKIDKTNSLLTEMGSLLSAGRLLISGRSYTRSLLAPVHLPIKGISVFPTLVPTKIQLYCGTFSHSPFPRHTFCLTKKLDKTKINLLNAFFLKLQFNLTKMKLLATPPLTL